MPKIYTPEEKARILDGVMPLIRSKSLRKACAEIGAPLSTVEDWIEADPELSVQYLRAREFRADYLNEESLEILDETPGRIIQIGEDGEGGSSRIDPAWVALQNHRANLRQRMIQQMAPKRYGAKLELEHSGEVKNAGPDLSRLPTEDLTAMRAILAKVDDAAPTNAR